MISDLGYLVRFFLAGALGCVLVVLAFVILYELALLIAGVFRSEEK